MQLILPVLLVLLLTGMLIGLIWRDHIQRRRLRLRMEKLYASQLFLDMKPMLKTAQKRYIEQLTVDKTGVAVRYLHLTGGESAFLMKPNGYRYLSPEQQEAMRAVQEECLPKLKDSEKYHLARRRIQLLNGDVEYAYRYTIANAYKARLVRAPYYDGSLQLRSW